MWIRILKDRDFTPPDNRRITIAYKKDMEVLVKRAWGDQLVIDGDAEEIETPSRGEGAPDPDADGDGHDDKTGRFVEGNRVGSRRKAGDDEPKA